MHIGETMSSNRVDFTLIKESAKSVLLKALKSVPGTKTIVWDKSLVGLFGLVANVQFLREHNVENMYFISSDKLDANNNLSVIFLTTPSIKSMDNINQQIRLEAAAGETSRKDYYLWCVPRFTIACSNCLQNHGISETFKNIEELPIHLYRFENDVASLELPDSFRSMHVDKDPISAYYIARALMDIQGIFGIIPNIYGKGHASKKVFDLMVGMRRELAGDEPQISPQIDQIILIDRSVDLITPLATQLTYEGLIDQFYSINNCSVKLPADRFPKSEGDSTELSEKSMSSKEKSVQLTSSEELYAELRDNNFSSIGYRLSEKAKQISEILEQSQSARITKAMHKVVHTLKARSSLETHTAVAEIVQERISEPFFRSSLGTEQEFLRGFETDKVNPFIEEAIASMENLSKVLQLICLQCVVNCGLKSKVLDYYKKEILQVYGFHHFITLDNLQKAGLLYVQQNRSTYNTIRKTLRLTVDDVNELVPTDISYVHSGYAPLSVRLVEFLHWPGWRAITEALSLLPGPTLTETQQLPTALRQRRGSGSSLQNGQSEPGAALVVFIGGCTYSEIAALRFLSSKVDQNAPDYFILTTNIINANTLIESLSEKLDSGL